MQRPTNADVVIYGHDQKVQHLDQNHGHLDGENGELYAHVLAIDGAAREERIHGRNVRVDEQVWKEGWLFTSAYKAHGDECLKWMHEMIMRCN